MIVRPLFREMSRPLLRGMFRNIVDGGGASPGLASLTIQFEDETGGTLPHRIYLDGILATTLTAGDTEHTITGLDWNTEYTVSIFSFDDPTESNELTVDIWTAPEDAPTLAAAATGENSIELTLTPPAVTPASINAGTGYSVEQSPNGSTGWTEIELVAVGDQPAEVTGLSGDTEYFFRARSVNGNPSLGLPPPDDAETHDSGYSAYSATTSDTTDADVAAPTLSSATIAADGETLTLVFSEVVSIGAGGNGGFNVDASTGGSNVTCTYVSGGGTDTLVYTLGTVINSGETCDLDYTQPGNGIEDGAGNDLASITSAAVTNNSIVGAVSYLFSEDFEGTGTPAGVTVVAGSPNFDYTGTDKIDGSQSAYCEGYTVSTESFHCQFSEQDVVYVYFKFRIVNASVTTSTIFFSLQTNAAVRADWYIRAGFFRLSDQTTQATDGYSIGTVYHCWATYNRTTGYQNFAFSTDGVRPTTGTKFVENTFTAAASGPTRLFLYGQNSGTSNRADIVFDKVRISATQIGDNPT